MPLLGPPPLRTQFTSTLEDPNSPWSNWFAQVFRILFSVQDSGTTAQRPTKNLWAGRPYFDTDLGKPIWYKTTGWVDATGASV